MRDPEWDDGSILAKISHEYVVSLMCTLSPPSNAFIRRFRARLVKRAGPKNLRRFIALGESYTACVAREAELRERGEVLSLKEFIPHRRNNSAVLLCYSLVEYILGIDLDDEIYEDPDFAEAYWAAVDHVCWSNVRPLCLRPPFQTSPLVQDVYSYDMEQSKGHTGNNVVTVLMKEKGISLQDAADYAGRQCNVFMQKYLQARSRVASSSTLSPDALRYIDSLGQWVVGNLVWVFPKFLMTSECHSNFF